MNALYEPCKWKGIDIKYSFVWQVLARWINGY